MHLANSLGKVTTISYQIKSVSIITLPQIQKKQKFMLPNLFYGSFVVFYQSTETCRIDFLALEHF